jgi:ligand-binding sensor domain-containing protein
MMVTDGKHFGPKMPVDDNVQGLFLREDGYPGVITDKGVCRFDGRTWQLMTAADGLPEGKVRLVKSDDKGNLWFGGEKGVSCWGQ